jgi:hypothetical protein
MRRFMVVLCLIAPPALAESPREALFADNRGCYRRDYDAAHLAKHPDQLVKTIRLSPDAEFSDDHSLLLALEILPRGGEAVLAHGICENTGGSLSCGLEGDAGWLMLEPTAKGLRATVGRDGISFETDTGFVTFGGGHSDDAVFAIPRAPEEACQ